MAAVDSKLAAQAKLAKNAGPYKPFYFAMYVKGGSDGALVLSKQKVQAQDSQEAKAKCGGGALFEGRCFGEEGKLILDCYKDPPATLAKIAKLVLQREADLRMNVECRLRTGGDEEAQERQPEGGAVPVASPSPQPGAGGLTQRIKQLIPKHQQALAANPGQKAKLVELSKKTVVFAQNGQAEAGELAIRQWEAAIAQTLQGKPAPAAAVKGDDGTLFTARLKKVFPLYQEAAQSANGSPQVAPMRATFGEIQAHAKARDFTAANEQLTRLIRLLTVWRSEPSPPPKVEDPKLKEFKARLPQVMQVYNKFAPQMADLPPLLDQVRAAAKQGQFARGLDLLGQIVDLVKSRAQAAGAAPAAAAGNRPAKRAASVWTGARDAVNEGINRLRSALLATEHPVLRKIADMGLNGLTKRLNVNLQAALLEFDSALGDEKANAAQRLSGLLSQYQKLLDTDPHVVLVDENPFGVDVGIRANLGGAVRQLQALVGEAAAAMAS